MHLARPTRHCNSSDELQRGTFEELLRTVRSCSLGRIRSTLYEVGNNINSAVLGTYSDLPGTTAEPKLSTLNSPK
jgi:hypothetical protein